MEIDLLCHFFDHLIVTDVVGLPFEDEDLLCHSFGCLSIAGEVFMPPTSYNIYPVGYQEEVSLNMDHGLHGSGFSSWAQFLVLTMSSVKAHFWTESFSLKLLFLDRQIKRDFFLFLSYSAVRMKNDWLVSGNFEEDQRWSDISFYILWRYKTLVSVGSCSFFPIEFLRRCSGGFICYGDQSLVIHLSKSKDPAFVSLPGLFFNLVSPPVSSPAKTRSGSVSVNFPGNSKLLVYYVSSVVQGDIINVIDSDHGLNCMFLRRFQRFKILDLCLPSRASVVYVTQDSCLCWVLGFFVQRDLSLPRGNDSMFLVIFLFTMIPCFVVWDVMMVCLKKGDDLLRQNWYPNFEIHSSSEPKSSDEFFRRPNEDEDQFWPLGIFPFEGVFITSVIKNFHRVVNHAPAIQAHPYVCGMLHLVVTGYFWSLVTEFWLQKLGSVNHLVSRPVFTFSLYCRSWGEKESSSMLDSFSLSDRTSY